ncbi:MAG: glycine zipper family protein [Acidobacteria bacterium]|nr:glycine zipper family protein [Acidobacteriota bacterium]
MKFKNTFSSKLLITTTFVLAVAFAFSAAAITSYAQGSVRVNDRQVGNIIRNIERRSDNFRKSFDVALDRSRLDGTYTEDNVNEYVKSFEDATNNLRSRFNGKTAIASDVDKVLNRAAMIDQFMRTNLKQPRVQGDWTLLKSDLQQLANAYSVAFNLNGRVLPPSVVAGQVPYRVSDARVQTLLNRIETRSDTFRMSFDRAMDRSRFNESGREENINEFVKDYENLTDMLRRKFDDRTSLDVDVSNVLVRAARIDDFMKRNLRGESIAQRDWRNLRADLNLLSNYYSLGFNLDNRRNMPPYTAVFDQGLTNADARFTGTYRLNMVQSDSARTIAGRATSSLNQNVRNRIFNNLVRRLESPEMLAVERNGMRVMLASSRSPQMTLDVDGQLHSERYPNGRTSNVRTTLVGDTLTVVSNGDRANDFTAVFTPLDNGRRLLVTRSVYAEQLNQPVTVRSYYDRTDVTARFNIYNNSSVGGSTGIGSNGTFFVPADMTLIASLNRDLSTKTARDGDRFTMTVRSPSQYSGAVIEGYVSNPNRSGRITGRSEVTLNYETIRLNNQTYRFAGITENVRTVSGETVRIDNEGAVRSGDNQTNRTIGRTAIGAGIGALLGAIISGGDGAAVGAAVGAGTGVGSVYIQGRDDLELMTGAEFTIRSSGPNS